MCIMEELTSILAAGAGSSAKLMAGGVLRRICPPKYPREYIQRIDSVCAAKAAIPAFLRGDGTAVPTYGYEK